jgi:hypothetical protein
MKRNALGVNHKIQSRKNCAAINFLCAFLLSSNNKLHCAILSAPLTGFSVNSSDAKLTASSSRRRFQTLLAHLHRSMAHAHYVLPYSTATGASTLVHVIRRAPTIFTRYSTASSVITANTILILPTTVLPPGYTTVYYMHPLNCFFNLRQYSLSQHLQ